MTKRITYRGFDRPNLLEAFNRVQNRENWKLPIDAWVPPEVVDLTVAAIEFFAGGGAEVVERYEDERDVRVRIKAPGYYALIGA